MTTQTQQTAVEQIETIVVGVDDIVEAMRRNHRDETEQRSHVLRVSPPFEGQKRATPHVSEDHTDYPPEMDPTPVHLSPETFVTGNVHKSPENHLRHPSRHESKSLFRDEMGYPVEEYPELPDDAQEQFENEWWAFELDEWESMVRGALTDDLTISWATKDGWVDVTLDVEYEE